MTSEFFWGTIYNDNPLAVRLDGETSPIGVAPDSLVDRSLLVTGNRVRCELSDRRVIIWGVSGGKHPNSYPTGTVQSIRYENHNGEGIAAGGLNYLSLDTPVLTDPCVILGTTRDDGAVDELIVKEAGLYLVAAGVRFTSGGSSGARSIFLQKNRNTPYYSAIAGQEGITTAFFSLNVATQSYFNVDDTLSAELYNGAGTSLAIEAGPTNHIAMTRIGS